MTNTHEDTHSPDLNVSATKLAHALIERRSITPDDAGCQQLMADWLAVLGFENEHMPFGSGELATDNLWSRRGNDGPVLCFAGHTDVVPTGPLERWTSDPFLPEIRDGLLYGRGAADMKSSLAAMLVAARRFVAERPDHLGSLALLITSDEEGPARHGTLKVMETLTARSECIDWCVVGEPSSHQQLGDLVRIGRRGSLSGMLKIKGIQGHVAYPQLARNPIEDFAPVLDALYRMPLDNGNAHFPPTSFQVVLLEAGTGAPNVTPGELRTRFNFRYSTEFTHQQLKQKVQALLEDFDIDYELDWHLSGEPFLTEPGVLTDTVRRAVERHTGLDPELSTGGGTSDGRFISPAGVDVVELGPVNASIHKIDEHVRVDDIDKLTDIYLEIMRALLPAR
ncbi:MAG: succinyl-diaminopimelate desuccinylase [Pseudomonadota bacterium]